LFKKADIFLAVGIVIIMLLVLLGIYLIPNFGKPVVCVYIEGEKIDEYDLAGEYREIDIETQYGYNLLIISEGMAFIDESDCTTGTCVSSRPISRPGAMIICAPHHLMIRIEAVPDDGDAQ
jgi:hypothetical protein